MRTFLPTLCCSLTLFLAGGLATPAAAQTLQLADGRILLGQVADASGDGLHVRRLDNGGTLDLRWEHLSPDCALRVKREWGLAGEEQGEIMVSAVEVRYLAGGAPRTLIGKIVEPAGADLHTLAVQQKGVVYRIPRADLLAPGVRQLEVPVTQIYTLDEFYAERLASYAPGEDADQHILLAEELEKVRDYQRAAEHLAEAKRLGNSRQADKLERSIERLRRNMENKKERDLIDDLKVARHRKEFPRGLELIGRYGTEFPQGKLKGDFEAEQRRFEKARERHYVLVVAEAWRKAIHYVAERKEKEPGVTLEAVQQYAQTDMGDDIAEYVARRFDLEAEEVRRFFELRENHTAAQRSDYFSYAIGSWVLGAEKVTKDTQRGADAQGDLDPADAREIDRIARAIAKSVEQSSRARSQEIGQEMTPEDWWTDADRQERVNWLRAFYGEYGGDLVMRGASILPCHTCGAAGQISQLGPGNKMIQVKCYLCQGTKYTRSFRAY